MSAAVDVLVPTRNRQGELATTLAGLASQDGPYGHRGQRSPDFDVVVSDQSDGTPSFDSPAGMAMVRVLRHRGHRVRLLRHLPRRGLAEHRAFLLKQAQAPYVLFLDDDVWLEPGTIGRLHNAITELGCGLVGNAVQALSHMDDHRPAELEDYEEWDGPPRAERITMGSSQWRRWRLHNAANPAHLAQRLRLRSGEWRAYKIAWVGGCVLFDRVALLESGGFDFWPTLPVDHAGEDVVAQWRVLATRGGAGILPSGAVHLEAPTTVVDRAVDAPDVLWPRIPRV